MTTRFFNGDGTRPERTVALPPSRRLGFLSPEHYRADPGLVDAVNVALLLGQPLLLTGEPGTGKTQLAYALAWELGLDVLKYETKSTSAARDLFYTYDVLRRFQHAQSGIDLTSVLPYVTYNALGKAILRTHPRDAVARWLPTDAPHPGPVRSIVLIDEVDKAPRDFPNDILNELDQLYFRVVEIDNEAVASDPEHRPIVILTSNSEKDLPDAFLRRCIFYHIPFSKPDALRRIVADRIGLAVGSSDPFLTEVLDLFYRLRAVLRKPPATAELLDWVATLVAHGGGSDNPLEDRSLALPTMGCLIKTVADQKKGRELVEQWVGGRI